MSDRDHPAPDRDLARAFAALRREERRQGPAFADLWRLAARRRERPARPLALAAAGAAVALLVVVVLHLGRPAPPPAADLSRWRPATDFLLRTPGREILGAPPPLGRGAGLGSLGFAPSALPNAVRIHERRSS
jgi:hypothetical protein